MIRESTWSLAHGRALPLGARAVVMGILNVTPDSFSDGGRSASVDAAVAAALRMNELGAAVIDIGGESTRPDAVPIDAAEEQRRVLPVVEELSRHPGLILSVDTYRAETARLAVAAGAHIVNDINGLQGEDIALVAARSGCGVVAMHNGRGRSRLPDVIDDQKHYFAQTLEIAKRAGIDPGALVLDPGFGFAKNPDENIELILRIPELAALGHPLLVGTSRKRFLGHVTGRPVHERDGITAVSSGILRLRGAHIFRVHDVPSSVDSLRLADAILDKAGRFESR